MGETIILILLLLTTLVMILSPVIVIARCDVETDRLRSEMKRLESQCEVYRLAERARRQRQRKQKRKVQVKTMSIPDKQSSTDQQNTIVWTGDNLWDVIALIGLHPSANQWTREEYEKVVREKGLKLFTNAGQVIAKVGDVIQKHADGDVSVIGMQRDTGSKPATPAKDIQDTGRPITEAEAIATACEISRAAEQARKET